MKKPVIGLALGAGAAKGLAHLGVLKVLEEEKIPIDIIAGTSIGSVFGALYADNADLELVKKVANSLKHEYLIDVTIPKTGLIKGEKIEQLFKLITKNKSFDQLARDFYVVAADIQTGEEVVINLGKVADAIRASISIPGIFKPKKIGNRLLVDGAVKNHIPVNVLINHGVDFIIAVDIRFGGRIGVKHKVENIFDIILLSLEIPNFEHVQNLANQCDILIQPDLSHISPARFDLVEECMQIGIKETKKVIPILKHKLQKIGVL